MPKDLVKVNLDLLFPEMVTPLLEVLAECRKKGRDYVVYSGYRSGAEQAKLWTYGRTLMYDPKGNKLKKVTNAQAFFSAHNYGIACDLYLDDQLKPGLQPIWTNSKGEYDLLKEIGTKWGFQIGVPSIPGGDPGHVQIPLSKLYDVGEHKVLGHWKYRVKTEGEKPALKEIWRELASVWPIDLRRKTP